MLNLISIRQKLNDQYPINTKYFYTVLCIKMNHMLTLTGILAIIFYKSM
jgi:hypothetical protein